MQDVPELTCMYGTVLGCPEGKVLAFDTCVFADFEPRSLRILETGVVTDRGLAPINPFGREAQSDGTCLFGNLTYQCVSADE